MKTDTLGVDDGPKVTGTSVLRAVMEGKLPSITYHPAKLIYRHLNEETAAFRRFGI